MQLEVGKCYRTRDGRKVGPAYRGPDSHVTSFQFEIDGCCYRDDGTFGYGDSCFMESGDIIAEWTDEPASILSAETIDMIAIDSLKYHADKDMEPSQREAFRIVMRYYGVTL